MYPSPNDPWGDLIHTIWNPYTPEMLALLDQIRDRLMPEYIELHGEVKAPLALERFLCAIIRQGPDSLQRYLD